MVMHIDGNYPFVGGPWDGQYKTKEELGPSPANRLWVAIPTTQDRLYCPTVPLSPSRIDVGYYEARTMSTPGQRFLVFVYQGLSEADVMLRLLTKYCGMRRHA